MPLMQPLTADTSKRVFFVRHGRAPGAYDMGNTGCSNLPVLSAIASRFPCVFPFLRLLYKAFF